MNRTEVIDRPHQIHPSRHACGSARRTPRAAAQHRQTTAERPIQALNERSVEHLTSRCAPQQGQEQLRTALNQSMDCTSHCPPSVLFDDLGDRHLRPGDQTWATARPALARPKRLTHDINVCRQSITYEQQRPPLGTPCHERDQAPNQVAVSMSADRAAQPQPRADHHRHRHPQHPGLRLDMDLIGLNLMQIAWLYQLGMMQRFRMRAGSLDPLAYRLGLQFERHLDRGNGTTVTDQGDHAGDRLLVGASAKEDRPSPSTEGRVTNGATVASPLLAMDADVAFTKLPPCRAVDIRAKCALRIDDTPPFGPKHRRVSLDPLHFSSPVV